MKKWRAIKKKKKTEKENVAWCSAIVRPYLSEGGARHFAEAKQIG